MCLFFTASAAHSRLRHRAGHTLGLPEDLGALCCCAEACAPGPSADPPILAQGQLLDLCSA